MATRATNRILGMTHLQIMVLASLLLGMVTLIVAGSVYVFHNSGAQAVPITAAPTGIQRAVAVLPSETQVRYPTLPPEWTATPIPSATVTTQSTATIPPTATGTKWSVPNPTRRPKPRPTKTNVPSSDNPTDTPSSPNPVNNSAADAAWADYLAASAQIDTAINELEAFQIGAADVPARYTVGRFDQLQAAVTSAIGNANNKFAAYVAVSNVPESARATQAAYAAALVNWSNAYVAYWNFDLASRGVPERYQGDRRATLQAALDQADSALSTARSNYYAAVLAR